MKKKIGLWIILGGLLFGPAIPAWSGTDMMAKRVLSRNFLREYNLFDGRFVLETKDRLKLTPTQEKKIEQLMLSFEELSLQGCAEIKIKELRLASAIKSEQIDREKIKDQIRKISNKKIDLTLAYLDYLLDIKMILTDSQISLLSKIKRHLSHGNPLKSPTRHR